MNHPSEDIILQHVLQILEDPASSSIREHLSRCTDCRAVEGKIREDVRRIESVSIKVDLPRVLRYPVLSGGHIRSWGWAAGLAAGFVLGILTTRLVDTARPETVPQRFVTKGASSSTSGFVSCRAQDLQTLTGHQ